MFAVQIMTMLTGIIGNVVDGMVTGRFLGMDAMAAYGFNNSVILAVAILGSVLSTGTSMVCSRILGSGDSKKTNETFSVCFTAALMISFIFAVFVFIFATPIAEFMGAKGELITMAADYMRGYAIASPGIVFVAFLMPVMQMDGEMKRLLIAIVVMTAGDIVFDLINAIVLHGGMFGMAIATALSYYIALFILILHFFKKDIIFRFPKLHLDGKAIGRMFSAGAPSAATQGCRLLITFILNIYLMGRFGSDVVAAHAVIISAGNLCLVPGTALASAVQVMNGILSGEEDRSGIMDMMKTALRYACVVNLILTGVFIALAHPVVSLFFQGNPDTLKLTVTGLRLYSLCMVFYAINNIYQRSCQSSGQFKMAYFITVMDGLVFPLIMALVLGQIFGVPSIWLCFVIGEAIALIVLLVIIRIRNTGKKGLEAIVPMPGNFGADIEGILEYSILENDTKVITEMSEQTADFCKTYGADRKTAYFLALAVEEMSGNVVEHGFKDGKPHRIDLRVIRKKEEWIIRIRDDCTLFNPNDYIAQYDNEDAAANIGLKIVSGIAKEMIYLNTMKLNNLIIKM